MKHLQFHPKELERYTEQLGNVLQRYVQRVQWLLSGIGVPLAFCKAQLKYRKTFWSAISGRIDLNVNLNLQCE